MRLALTLLTAGGDERRDLQVVLDDAATAGELADALAARAAATAGTGSPALATVLTHPRLRGAAAPPARPTLWAYGRPVDGTLAVSAVLQDGALVALDEDCGQATWLVEPDGFAEIRVAGGPASGSVTRLGLGTSVLGSGRTSTLVIADPTVPPAAATVAVGPGGQVSVTPAPGTELTVDGAPATGATSWPVGAAVRIGETVLVLTAPEAADAHLTPTGDGGLAYNRPPRLLPPRRGGRLVVPQEPAKADAVRLQLLGALLPLLLGGVMWYATKSALSLLFCLLSPALLIGSYVSDSRFGRKKHRGALREYRTRLASYESDLEELRARDQADRRAALPDPATALLIATGPRRRLWERRLDDPDTLHLRVGLTDLPAAVELQLGPGAARDVEPPAPPAVRSVPVSLPLSSLGVVGVAGPRRQSLGLLRWLVAQAAILHSPRDLSIVVLSPAPDAAEAWNWVRWLPHAAPRDGQDCVALVGADPETVARRVAELVAEIARRREAGNAVGTVSTVPDRNILVVLDGARALRRVPGMPQVLSEGPAVGVYAICADDDERLLPEECRTVAGWVPPTTVGAMPTRIRFRGAGLELIGEALADTVHTGWCQRLARALAPVRDVSRDEADSTLPDAARLLSLLGMPDPTGHQVRQVWDRNGRTTEVPVGYGTDGVFTLDLRRDGPHALVAGTTGAGKSELLQSLIASLAVANRPDTLNFVLIDYKGGSAFQDCARLPHTVGMVSDLDAHLTKRALASLAAELKRREEILFDAGAKDIEDYWDTKRIRPQLEPMARLVLVIDEFASLVEELPDFVAGLVDIARRGRSLGVHLMLATQRPAGVVSGDIRANTNLRIALRVTSAEESQDVIDAGNAASIAKSTPGRCYVRSGASSLALVQAARIGGRRAAGHSRAEPEVLEVRWPELGRPAPRRAQVSDGDELATDLAVLVDAVCEAARDAGIGQQESPWLPPLPDVVTTAQLHVPAAHGRETPPVPFGLCDIPADQARAPLTLDLPRGGNLLVAGSPRSGRSTVLRTIAGSLAAGTSPHDAHLYAIDCGANALLPLVSLPHCGAVVGRDQVDRVSRLLDRLLAEVSRRQQVLAAHGASSLAEQRAAAAPEDRLPWMVLLLDRWEGFTAAFETYDMGRLVDAAMRLFREGPAVGLRVVMSSDRSGLIGQVSAVFDDRLVLRFNDANEYAMAGISPKEIPSAMGPGRALRPTAAGVLEAQVALLDADPAGPAQVAALQAIGRRAHDTSARPAGAQRPMRVDALPVRVTAAEVLGLDAAFIPPSPLWALIGAGGDELAPVGVDLAANGPGFVIAGPPRSGRSTTLTTMAMSLIERGVPIIAVTPRRSPLRTLAARPGVLAVLDDTATPDDLKSLAPGGNPYAVLVDDAELLYDGPLDSSLLDVLQRGRDGGCALVVAGAADAFASQYRGFVTEARRSRSGVLIAPDGGGGDLFGVRLPRDSGGGPAGRAIVVTSGNLCPVQVALPD